MDFLRNWIVAICAVSIICAIVQAIVPKNAVYGNVKMVSSLLLVCAMLSPLKKLDLSEFRAVSQKMNVEITDKTSAIDEENRKIKQNIIEERLSAYILKRATQNGDVLRVSVKCKDELPESVAITAKNGRLSESTLRMIEQECGIPRDRIDVKHPEG